MIIDFINVNICRQINLLIQNWNVVSIVTNIFLIIKEGFNPKKMLGIILGFLAICGSQTLYFLLNKLLLGTNKQFIKYTIDICLNATLLYFYTLIIATLYCNIKASKHIPKYDKDFVIILGSKIRKDGSLTPLLQGSDEVISEAEAIKNYLLSKGISKNQIIVENKSTNTFENFNFSKKKINDINNSGKIFFATTNYHVFRSGVIANENGIDCEGIGSKTKWYFYTNALIREFIANIFQERKKTYSAYFND